MKRYANYIIVVILTLLAFYLSFYCSNSSFWQMIDKEFILKFLGVFLGLAITITTFLFSMVDKLRERIQLKIDENIDQKEKLNEQLNIIVSLFKEISENTKFIFYGFIIIVFLIIIKDINVPIIKIPFDKPYGKLNIIKFFQLEIFFLSLYGLYDSLTALFLLIESAWIELKNN